MDADLFIRIANIKSIPYIPETLAEFRIQPNSKTAEGSYKFARELLKINKKYGGRFLSPTIKSALYIITTQPLRRINWIRQFVQKCRKESEA